MRLPGLPWKSILQWRPDGPRLFKYAVVALGLHVAGTILQLPAALQAAQNAGEELCILMRENSLWYLTGTGRFFGLVDWPPALESELNDLTATLAKSCVVRAYPVGQLRSILLGDIELEVGADDPPEGIVLEIRHHLFWRGILDLFGFVERDDRIGLAVIGYRRWQWPEAIDREGAPATDGASAK